jgi:catechol 2,3-dioxygenase
MGMTETQTGSQATLPTALKLGAVDLTVRDLDRAIAWYERSLGFRVIARGEGSAELGTDETVVILHEDPQARPAGRHAGLYHYALLYPSREELARVERAGIAAEPFDGGFLVRDPWGTAVAIVS